MTAPGNYYYVIGPDPYEFGSTFYTKGNGEWNTRAPDAETALRSILGSIPFPGEATGRYANVFQTGVALEGVHEDEVIQLWSNEPEAIAGTAAFAKAIKGNAMEKASHHWGYHPHSGNGGSVGLCREIHVSEIRKYIEPPVPVGLLMDKGDARALSPLGVSLGGLSPEKRQQMHMTLTEARITNLQHKWALKHSERELRAKQKLMEQQIYLSNIYISGVRSREVLCTGHPAPKNERYHVFQKRLYLDDELGLLANLIDMDFRDMEAIDNWLLETGHWKKLLPFPKTILVTRVRKRERAYSDTLLGLLFNHFNMEHVVWLRDGDNVVRLSSDVTFTGQLFADPDQFRQAKKVVQEHIWNSHFNPSRGERHEKGSKPGLQRDGHKLEEPYITRGVELARFKTMQAWLDSDYYSSDLDQKINEVVGEFTRKRNANTLPFVVFLQGLVDNTDLLQIPRGTDLFNTEVLQQYFTLLFDYTNALTTTRYTGAMKKEMDPKRLRENDWVIALDPRNERRGSGPRQLMLLRVHQVKDGVPLVKLRKHGKRAYSHDVKAEEAVPLLRDDDDSFIPFDLPPELAEAILDDRDWKTKYREFVPLLAQWKTLTKRYGKNTTSGVVIELPQAAL